MNSLKIKHQVSRFRKEYHLRKCSLKTLVAIFEKQGFTLIEFNPVLNDTDVDTIIHAFKLEELVSRSSGFIFTDQNHRLVFVKEGLTEEEKLLVLAHEEGHYYLEHVKGTASIGKDVVEEFEANEFAHYLLIGSFRDRLRNAISKHKRGIIIGILFVSLMGSGGIAAKEYHDRKLYEGEYYVAIHGVKYHLKNCVTIQGHETRRLTKEDVETGEYTPCSVCLPQSTGDKR